MIIKTCLNATLKMNDLHQRIFHRDSPLKPRLQTIFFIFAILFPSNDGVNKVHDKQTAHSDFLNGRK